MSKDNYHRNPNDEKVKGVDYKFYKQLLAGKFDRQVNSGLRKGAMGQDRSFKDTLIKA